MMRRRPVQSIRDIGAVGRRGLLGAMAAGVVGAPWVARRAHAASKQIYVRTPGGEYDHIMRQAVYDPFQKATGIAVTPIAATASKMLAMLKAGESGLDVVDTTAEALVRLQRVGGLVPITYDKWHFASPADIVPEMRAEYRVASYAYAEVLAYNTDSFPRNNHPTNWAEFWDTSRFPGPRTLPDIDIGQPPIEVALLATGIPMKSLYPLDLDAAFASLTKIRGSIPKFWNTAALSSEMFADKEVVLGEVANGRVQTLIDKGLPLAIEWNQCMILQQAYGIVKTSLNKDAAQAFVDFASQAGPQANYAKALHYGPSNTRAYDLLPASVAATLPGGPISRGKGFFCNSEWWVDNLDRVVRRWSTWILG